jgi:NIMA (never in mitosis gene a)-related kinase 1/4/5
MEKYRKGKILGRGSFGQAVQVTNIHDGKTYVIKEIDVSRMPRSEREAAKLEAKVRLHRSPHMIQQ